MSFINSTAGQVYAPGYFLGHEDCVRVTAMATQTDATIMPDGSKIVKAGTPIPSNDANILGFLYEDVDVTTGHMPGSLVIKGTIYKNRLPVTLAAAAETALLANGWTIGVDAEVTRPDDGTTTTTGGDTGNTGDNTTGGDTGNTGDNTTGGDTGNTGGNTTGGDTGNTGGGTTGG